MFNRLMRWVFRWWHGPPCFQVFGKASDEATWRVVDVYDHCRRNLDSRWPFVRGSCTAWCSHVVVVGRDFAEWVLLDQAGGPSNQDCPTCVAGGRLRDPERREKAGAFRLPSAGEILAHECGHTRQARRLSWAYLPLVGALTLFREGDHFWNYFENDASAAGQFGGVVPGSVRPDLAARITKP